MVRMILSLVLAVLPVTVLAIEKELSLYVGEARVLQVGDVERVAVGNGKLITTSLLKNGQLVIIAESPGVTTVHIWGKKGWEHDMRVTIGLSDAKQAVDDIRSMLKSVKAVSVREVGGRVIIEGDVNKRDLEVLKVIQKVFPNTIVLARESSLKQDKMIYMKVQITEFSTNALDELGIDWSNPIDGPAFALSKDFITNDSFRVTPGLPSFSQDTMSGVVGALPVNSKSTLGYFGIATEITSRLNFLTNTGDALILASPRLSARSGGEAEFLAGGEVPLPTVDKDGQTNIEFKDVGVKLVIKPVADDFGNITARIETEVSTIDKSVTVNGIPGFLTRRTNTDISMKQGETLVLSGLINSELGKDINKLKGLGDLPIIGWLFRSESFRNKRTDLVIFVTPTVIDPSHEINKEEIARHQKLIDKFQEITGEDIVE